MLEGAEAEAKRRGCRGVWLDTFSAAAARFYEKQGYKPFGIIDDYPPGAARHFLSKPLLKPLTGVSTQAGPIADAHGIQTLA